MRFDKRAKLLSIAAVSAVAVGIGVGASVPTRIVGPGKADPQLASLMSARSPGLRTSAAVSSKEPVVEQTAFTPTFAPRSEVLSERSAPVKIASAAPPVGILPPATPVAPAILAPSPAPALVAAAPVAVIPAAPLALGGGSALIGAAVLPIIPAVLGGGGGGGGGISVAPAVPEPATWLMMITGFGVLGFALRRRRRQLRSGDAIGASPDLSALARAR